MNITPFTSRIGRLVLFAVVASWTSILQASAAEPARVTTTPTQTSRHVAEPFWIDWTVTASAGVTVTFPATGDKLGDFDILDTQDLFDIPGVDSADRRTWTRRLQLESIVTGELTVPALEIQVADPNSSQILRSQAVPVQIVSVLEQRGDPMQFRDIQSVVDVAVPNRPSHAWMGWTLAGFSVVALTISAAIFTRRKRWLTPAQWATQQLDQLEAASHEQAGNAAVIQLASIMQSYAQMQFLPPEPGRTSEELLLELTEKELLDFPTLEQLRELFAMADEAKFARLPVSAAEFQAMLKLSHSLVGRLHQAADSEPTLTASKTTEVL
ncbi:hypothetical protein M4951_13395 [Blastopirellula sp. J2-11]|uniref:hypothetical protein n=1 Tax=Blastopirellula sp. J2-11 TaxID=2943192 RepID=UPI0021CAD698|nr:hypothetical protein [Blastopirellula sp. J2-11]UUO04389.1 hypothetical protein M4951_13395 [Blastopirellula sp. J2-11]